MKHHSSYYYSGENISLLRYEDWRWDIRDVSIETTEPTEATCPACPVCPPPTTVVVIDEKTKTIVNTICPEETTETTSQSEETKGIPSITPGLELHSAVTAFTVIGVSTVYLRRRRK